MIQSIHLTNFQAHSDLLIELDERVTTIVGPSDVGKSSVVRALRWSALNVPVGCMIKDGTKQASVELIADGRKVVRTRGSENAYSLDGKEYRAFRSDVPQDISSLLNLSDLNFQGQHDPLYWFSSTAGDVSRQLNAVVNLEIIDKTLAEAAREANRAKTLMEAAEEQLTQSVVERDSLKWVDDADAELRQVEEIRADLDSLKDKAFELDAWIHEARISNSEAIILLSLANDSERLLGRMAAVGKAAKSVADLAAMLATTDQARREKDIEIPDISRLSKAADDLFVIRSRDASKGISELIQAARQAMAGRDSEVPDLSDLDVIVDLLKTRRDMIRNLKLLLDEVWLFDEGRQEMVRLADKAHEELESKTEGRCPFCGKEMN